MARAEILATQQPARRLRAFAPILGKLQACNTSPSAFPKNSPRALSRTGSDLSRAALEALATEAYRERKISHTQLGQLLGFETRMEVDAFLKVIRRGGKGLGGEPLIASNIKSRQERN